MTTQTFLLRERLGTDISNRYQAAILRQEVATTIDAHGADSTIEFDFSGVRSMSDSLADELFAVLVEERSEDWFRQHIRVRNLTPLLRKTLLEAIQSRLHATETA